jgi:hypothetical protein
MAEPSKPDDLSPADTLRRDELRLMSLFVEFLHRYGLEKTRQMFGNYYLEPNTVEDGNFLKLEMLRRLDGMKPKPNIKQLARELLAAKGIGPGDPGYQNQFDATDKQIRRVKKDRNKIEAKFGAASPPLARGEPARFRIVKTKKRDSSPK